jgi:hypothetical protein
MEDSIMAKIRNIFNVQNIYKYNYVNPGQNVGVAVKDYTLTSNIHDAFSSNCVFKIMCVTLGTGTSGAYCEYNYYRIDGNNASAQLDHIAGNGTKSSNRPYIELNDNVPEVKMDHNGGYTVKVAVMEVSNG